MLNLILQEIIINIDHHRCKVAETKQKNTEEQNEGT